MQKINEVLANKKNKILKDSTVNSYTVNSNKRFISTVNSREEGYQKTLEEEINEVIKNHSISKEGVAQYIAELLNDTKSIKLYQILVSENKPEFLMERAHYVKEQYLQGKIRTNMAIYYIAVLKRLGVKVKFKKTT